MTHHQKLSGRSLMTIGAVIILELYLYMQYALAGATYHFWLHAFMGGAVGLLAMTVWALIRRTPVLPVKAWEAGAAGHVYSAVPDILFIVTGILHMYWMDVFAFHISIHYIPYPVITAFILFLLAFGAWIMVRRRQVAWSVRFLILFAALLFLVLSFRQPLPGTPEGLTTFDTSRSILCPFAGHPSR